MYSLITYEMLINEYICIIIKYTHKYTHDFHILGLSLCDAFGMIWISWFYEESVDGLYRFICFVVSLEILKIFFLLILSLGYKSIDLLFREIPKEMELAVLSGKKMRLMHKLLKVKIQEFISRK